MPATTLLLASETDLEGFRTRARSLLARQVPPDQVAWTTPEAGSLFAAADLCPPDLPPGMEGDTPAARVPPAFLQLCATVALHADAGRFDLLYRLLWRLVHEPALRHDPLDVDLLQAGEMARAVRRDMHKMRAFVRFTRVDDGEATDKGPLHVAWFEPEHHIVEANAPFFQRRFAGMRWAILTPRRSVRWEPPELHFAAGGRREVVPPPDAGETLWLTYYANIFNPTRLKLAMMQKEMPRRYWHNLPEARLIGELSAQAMERSGTMVEQAPTSTKRRVSPLARHPVQDAPAAPVTIYQLADLKAATDRCRACPIGAHATQSVVGQGSAHARLMVVGEQPGDHEDLRGMPFVGPAGRLFDKAVAQLGWDRSQLYVTNAVKHFKFELRGQRRMHKTPAQQEVDACLHWLEDEMALVAPQAILALGATAARAVLGRPVAVMQERGQWATDPRGRPVLVTLHPSALLRADPAHGERNFARWLEDLALATPWTRPG